MVNIANIVTLGRLFSAPLIVWLLMEGLFLASFWVFLLAALSDGIDGYLAKHHNMETELGRYLDPIADKVLLASTYIAMGLYDHVPTWLVIMVISRDIIIILAIFLAHVLDHELTIKPIALSKVNTLMQIALMVWLLGCNAYYIDLPFIITNVLIFIVTITTILSLIRYISIWIKTYNH